MVFASTAIFLRARAEIKELLCELASNAKIWGARATEHLFKVARLDFFGGYTSKFEH